MKREVKVKHVAFTEGENCLESAIGFRIGDASLGKGELETRREVCYGVEYNGLK